MKKILIAAVLLGVIGMFAVPAHAEGLEMAGSVVAGMGYQHQNNALATEMTSDGDIGSVAGPMGRYLAAEGPKQDNFNFFVDSVELDLMKSFGENIRLRADLDFGRVNSGFNSINATGFVLEQAYATANIPLGNGVELLIGRFNVPIGFESVDVTDNDTISQSILIRSGIRPTNSTGAKLYYAFSDLVDFHFYLVNRLTRDSYRLKINDFPSAGFRLGFNWGEQGTESTFGLSGFLGWEHDFSTKRNLTYGGDLDLSWWATESFNLGLEGIGRRDNAVVAGAANMWTFGGLANLKYLFSDVWDGTIKYALAYQNNPGNGQWDFIGTPIPLAGAAGVAKQTVHEISLAGNYMIADGAKLKLEGRFDIISPSGALSTQYVYGGALAFAYDF
jgi:hypothetical protein